MHVRYLALAATTAAGILACGTDPDFSQPEAAGTGTILQRWRIDGAADPAQCDRFGVATVRLVLHNDAGQIYATTLSPCSELAVTSVVRPQSYQGVVTVLGADGSLLSDGIDVGAFTVVANEQVVVDIDLSSSTFRPSP